VKLVIGLGNPGREYDHTRHNVGFEVLDELVRRTEATLRRSWTVPAWTGKVEIEGEGVLLVKPRTFMNRSGQAIAAMMRKRGLKPADVIVVLDDLELPCGRIRIRKQGGAGGHKGLQSVIQALGADDFVRVRVGIGPRPAGEELVEHVLARFTAEERREVEKAVEVAADAVTAVVQDGVEKAMNRFNERTVRRMS
jgi:peptidyl-tRNA hydrolase, PTH1 family